MRPSDERPTFWIIGGPNGSGKSTAYSTARVEDAVSRLWIVNPDLLTVRLQTAEHLPLAEANLEAVKRLEVWLEATLRVHRSVGVETVLSTDKYRRLVSLAKSLGYHFHLFYVALETPELNLERVRARVLKGGHDVPEAKVEERYWRSLAQMPWFLIEADSAELYDNSGSEPQLVARKTGDGVILQASAHGSLADAIRSAGS